MRALQQNDDVLRRVSWFRGRGRRPDEKERRSEDKATLALLAMNDKLVERDGVLHRRIVTPSRRSVARPASTSGQPEGEDTARPARRGRPPGHRADGSARTAAVLLGWAAGRCSAMGGAVRAVCGRKDAAPEDEDASGATDSESPTRCCLYRLHRPRAVVRWP